MATGRTALEARRGEVGVAVERDRLLELEIELQNHGVDLVEHLQAVVADLKAQRVLALGQLGQGVREDVAWRPTSPRPGRV